MRCGPLIVWLALVAGAPMAAAQNAGTGNADPAEPQLVAKKHHTARKPVAVQQTGNPEQAKPEASPTAAAAQQKTATAKPAPVKPQPAPPDAGQTQPVTLSPADRLKVQAALSWSGDFAAAKNEDPLEGAIRNFQKRNKAKVTGVLTAEQRAGLVAAAEDHEHQFGWRVVIDPATGIRIGLPTKLVPNAHDAAHGTQWSSPHGEVQVETFRVKGTSLAALFEAEKKKAGRTVEHAALSDDGFIVSGLQGLKLFTVRAKQRDGEVRGFTLLYDQMMESIVAPAMVAMASAFAPFPERPAPFATLAKKVDYGTGLIVSSEGHILTAQKVVEGCNVIVADGLGNAERIADDESNGLALLRVYGVRKLPALALTGGAASPGDITLLGIPDPKEQNGGKALAEIKAKLADSSAIVLRDSVPMAGFAGAAALDGKNAFIGVMETRSFALASIDASVPPVRLIGTVAISDFLAKHKVPLAATGADPRTAAIRVICVRN